MLLLFLCLGTGLVIAPRGMMSADADKEAQALEVLQRKVAQREKQSAAKSPAQLPTGEKLSLAGIEQLYLKGQISARQFHRYVEAMGPDAAQAEQEAPAPVHDRAIAVLRKSAADPSKNPPPGPVLRPDQIPELKPGEAEGEVEEDVEQDFADMEAKMDRLLRWKAEREKEETNAVATGAGGSSSPLTKRQRLDQLLRLHINGKITEKEYNEQRAKIIAEPK